MDFQAASPVGGPELSGSPLPLVEHSLHSLRHGENTSTALPAYGDKANSVQDACRDKSDGVQDASHSNANRAHASYCDKANGIFTVGGFTGID